MRVCWVWDNCKQLCVGLHTHREDIYQVLGSKAMSRGSLNRAKCGKLNVKWSQSPLLNYLMEKKSDMINFHCTKIQRVFIQDESWTQHVAIKMILHSAVYACLDTDTHIYLTHIHIDFPTRGENHDVIFFRPSVLLCSFPVVKVNQLMPPRGDLLQLHQLNTTEDNG